MLRLNIVEGSAQDIPDTSYSLHLDKIKVDPVANDYDSKTYTFHVRLLENNQLVSEGNIGSVQSLKLAGHRFFYRAHGENVKSITLNVGVKDAPKPIGDFQFLIGQDIEIPGMKTRIKVSEFVPDFAISSEKVVISRSREFNNPAVKIEIFDDAKGLTRSAWHFLDFPEFSHGKGDSENQLTIVFKEFDRQKIGGIRVVRDPGRLIVFFGFIILALGTLINSFVIHKKIWIHVRPENGKTKVLVAGWASKNKLNFKRDFQQTAANLEKIP